MSKIKYFCLFIFLTLSYAQAAMAQTDTLRHEVKLETTMGTIRVALYNETPLHRDNFLRLVRHGDYDGLLFHRVIQNFMIQSGDPDSRNAKPGQELGESSIGDNIPAEIRLPKLFHKRGALAMAREGDDVNPERKSSGSQFYIVYGDTYGEAQIKRMQKKIMTKTNGKAQFTPEMLQTYTTLGGSPHLDGLYTVFGEVVEGMDVVEKIQSVATDSNNRPLEDVRIIKATVVK